MRLGVGACSWEDGSTYQGDWAQDKRHGNGIFKTAEGHKYEGAYVNDVKHGAGKLTYKNGEVVEGTWENDRLNGLADVTKDGSTMTVIFVNDLRVDDASVGTTAWDCCYIFASIFMLIAVALAAPLALSMRGTFRIDDGQPGFYGLFIFWGVYQLMSARNRATLYLDNMQTIKDFSKTISKTIAAEPIVIMGIQNYHIETRRVRTKNGTRTQRVRVDTHRAEGDYDFSEWKDISPPPSALEFLNALNLCKV
jgi:hypothetical protein